MKKTALLTVVIIMVISTGLWAQSTTAGAANGMTLNGATGLILVPDANIGWENAKVGVDAGYAFVWTGGQDFDHLPRFAVSIAGKVELYGLFHFSENSSNPDSDFANMVFGTKLQLYKKGGSALALGGDVELANNAPSGGDDYASGKFYLAATYSGRFFNVPAVTSATVGWQIFEADNFSTQFIYGMGFSMSLFPEAFNNHVFWITDFANFSYAIYSSNINLNRGAFNTGIRIRPFKAGRFNMVIDIVGTDLLDDGQRGLSLSASGGLAF